ncbi:MAG: acyl--CoA ligase [Lachnospiraceae bacterium]|nr:acyl--CoA ligase [Lachnospiraceae bacterium]
MRDTILHIIREEAEKKEDKPFAADMNESISYKEAWQRIKTAADVIKNANVKKGDTVLAECTQDIAYIIAGLAIQLANAVFVPVEHGYSAERLDMIRRDTEPSLFICRGDDRCGIKTVGYQDLQKQTSSGHEHTMPDPEDLAEILFTTGTTGTPRGIEITHAANIALAENIAFGTEMREGNMEWIPLAVSHSHGLRCCYANFYRGGSVVLTDGIRNIAGIWELLKKYRVTAMDLSPTVMTVLLRLTKGDFTEVGSRLDYIQIGTAALPEELKEQIKKAFQDIRLYNFYGSTESGRSCVLNFNSADDAKHCIGREARNAHIFFTDEKGNEIETSENRTGLLASAGKMNMRGYHNDPEKTAEVLREGVVYTKDEGYMDKEGRVFILGRRDDVINYMGIKITPEEIEEKVKTIDGIADCACVGISDASAGQIPVLFYSLQKGREVKNEDISSFLKLCLDANKMVKKIYRIEEIPRTSNGKLQRKLLREINVREK